ncbi:glycoside hydrolase family 28 protein [Olivibacter sp. SDN3]|nr:glycoside hydrolase family 28 protein [Olivibacter sp. SDN3]
MHSIFCHYKPYVCLIFLLLPALSVLADDPVWVSKVGSRDFNIAQQQFVANNYGALGDGITLNTNSLQQAIDACAEAGGGTVVLKPGKYLTGAIFLKSGVCLQLDEGVEILGSQELKDYPIIDTRVAGIEMKWPAALVNIIGQKKASITGKGIINGQGKPFWDAYWSLRKEYEPKGLRWIVDYDAQRPRTLLVDNCEDIVIKELTFQEAGFWTVHLLYSSYITVDGVVIRNNTKGIGPSTDGIDIDSSSWILVKNADIDCNDDNFCIKSGRDWDGLRVNRPTEYVLITDCISRRGGGLITFGSETSGGMRHIIARNLKAQGTKVGMRFKSARNRGGVVEDIYLENIQMDSVDVAFEVTPNWNPSYSYSELPDGYDSNTIPQHWKKMLEPVVPERKGIPTFQHIHIAGIQVKYAKKALFVDGLEERPLEKFHLVDVSINAKDAGSIKHARNWQIENVHIQTPENESVQQTNTANIKL